jgi:hypothetical protein
MSASIMEKVRLFASGRCSAMESEGATAGVENTTQNAGASCKMEEVRLGIWVTVKSSYL